MAEITLDHTNGVICVKTVFNGGFYPNSSIWKHLHKCFEYYRVLQIFLSGSNITEDNGPMESKLSLFIVNINYSLYVVLLLEVQYIGHQNFLTDINLACKTAQRTQVLGIKGKALAPHVL